MHARQQSPFAQMPTIHFFQSDVLRANVRAFMNMFLSKTACVVKTYN